MNPRLRVPRAAFVMTSALVLVVAALAVAQSPRAGFDTANIFVALELKQGQTVGEIGAGNGDLTLEAARIVGSQGKIYTSELGENRVETLQRAVDKSGLTHITVVAGDPNETNFAELCCDAIFMRNVYHHFGDPAAMTASIFQALKPDGRVAVVDFMPSRDREEAARPADRANDGSHGVSSTSVARELREAGLQIVRTQQGNDRWFMVVGVKPR